MAARRVATFSTGRRRLLAIARAFAGAPTIVILDEVTSSVDSGSESKIEAATRELRLRERGTHDELMEKGGIYARLHELQFAPSA